MSLGFIVEIFNNNKRLRSLKITENSGDKTYHSEFKKIFEKHAWVKRHTWGITKKIYVRRNGGDPTQ